MPKNIIFLFATTTLKIEEKLYNICYNIMQLKKLFLRYMTNLLPRRSTQCISYMTNLYCSVHLPKKTGLKQAIVLDYYFRGGLAMRYWEDEIVLIGYRPPQLIQGPWALL